MDLNELADTVTQVALLAEGVDRNFFVHILSPLM